MSFRLLVLSMLATLAVQDAVGYQGMVGLAKKVFVPTTSVKYVIPVVTSLTTVSSTCFIAVNVTGNCRRRRWSSQQEAVILSLDDTDEFDIDTILPSLPRLHETTASEVGGVQVPDIESSRPDSIGDDHQRGWTFTANLAGLTALTKNRWLTNPGFGLTYVDFKTSTITQTDVSTVTLGRKVFIVSGCLPSGFVYPSC